jgi:HlyD family secretion protein
MATPHLSAVPSSPDASAAPPSMDRKIERKPWKKLLPWGIGAGVLALGAAAYLIFSPGAGARAIDREDAEITEVRRAPFHDFVPARAEVAPLQTVFIDAVEGGQVAQLVAQDGDLVMQGSLLAVLSNPQLARDIGAAEANVTGRISDVRGQLLQLQRSRADRDREIGQAGYDLLRAEQQLSIRQGLHQKGFLSDVELKTVQAEAAHHRSRLSSLKAAGAQENAMTARQTAEIQQTLRQLQENLIAVRRSLDALQVRAPVAGRLTAFELQPGQTVKAGERVGQVDTEGAYKLTAGIDEFYLGRLSLGQTATARHDGKTYRMRVSRIFPQVANGRFRVEFAFVGEMPPGVRRGQTLDVEVTLGDTRPALVLPNGPFVETTGGQWVFVLGDDGRTAERRTIKTGRRNPQEIEVLSGLRPGERVLTSSYDGLANQTRLILR